MKRSGGFLAELKRRNVIRMAVMYLVCAWVLVQVAETVLPIFLTPGWVLQALVVLVAVIALFAADRFWLGGTRRRLPGPPANAPFSWRHARDTRYRARCRLVPPADRHTRNAHQ